MAEHPQENKPGLEGLPVRLKRTLGVVATIGATGAAVQVLWRELQDPGQRSNYLVGIFAVLLLSGGSLLWRALRWRIGPRSYFKHPAALLDVVPFRGREEDTNDLLDRLSVHRLVFLVGPSGVGKTEFLAQRVAPKLQAEPSTLCVLLGRWGKDWSEGPRELLAQELSKVRQGDLEKLQIRKPVAAEEAFRCLDRLRDELGLRIVLLFDQLDDYVLGNVDCFLYGERRIGASELEARNPFWKEVAERVRAGRVRCVFSVREDLHRWMECFRFVDVDHQDLPQLEREWASACLDAITQKAELTDPAFGFQQLRERLLLDLAPKNSVLPVRMKIAFRALALLQSPTLVDYLKAGGLAGLQALYIERNVDAVSGGPWKAADIHRLLASLVSAATGKTVQRSFEEVSTEFSQEGRSRDEVARLLRNLEQRSLLRSQLVDGKSREIWQLDHDFLAQGVLELVRRSQRWQVLLADAAHAYFSAGSLLSRWRTLLAPATQVRLLLERLRGKLVYGEHRGFAMLSTLRFVANVWVITAGLGFLAWQIYAFREQTRDLFVAGNLSTIHGMPERVRRAVLDEAFRDESSAETFGSSAEFVGENPFGKQR